MIERPSYMTDQEWQDYRLEHKPKLGKVKPNGSDGEAQEPIGRYNPCEISLTLTAIHIDDPKVPLLNGKCELFTDLGNAHRLVRICSTDSIIGSHLFLKEIHEAYAKWATAEIGFVASKQKLADELRQRGYKEDHPRNLTRFRDIRLKD
jgi:hypothetical protein